MEITITDYLPSLSGRILHYFPNPGNAGDSLITNVALRLFTRCGLDYRFEVRQDRIKAAGKTLVYAGGGSFMPHCAFGSEFTARFHDKATRLVILPQSVSGNEDLLRRLSSNVDLICRDPVSYEHARKHASKANVMLSHDIAFFLNVDDILRSSVSLSFAKQILLKAYFVLVNDSRRRYLMRAKNIYKYSLFEVTQHVGPKRSCRVLNCFRTDFEQSGIAIPRDNCDLSEIFAFGTYDKGSTDYASRKLLAIVGKHEEIRTNRLHVAIAGAMVGKRVHLYPNSYYKCEAVYQYSMKERFPNVNWMGHFVSS